MKVKAYAAFGKSEDLKPFEYDAKALDAHSIDVEISHCGICHSDLHLIDDGLGITKFPFVPGHEIIGTIKEVGASVKQLKVGDRVGIGWQSGSCHACEYCIEGNENCCSSMESTCLTQFGGYASRFSCDAKFAVKIPDKLTSAQAAPLMCGGVTVYQPLRYYNVTPNQRTAVIGIGGLGHLAIQYLSAFGCEVTAISTSASKRKEAESLGAHNFIDTSSSDALKKVAGNFDFILNTVSADLPLQDYFQTLKSMGKFIMIGLGSPTLTVPAPSLVLGQKILGGSWIGSPSMIEEMLEFSARKNINVKVEEFSMAKINEGIKAVRGNQVRYRAVLVN
jgi:alcohol/geraniol dehydrogenase (NADP+)